VGPVKSKIIKMVIIIT